MATHAQPQAAGTVTGRAPVGDVLGAGLRLLLVGINPGRRSAETGCHFAGPGNRFWPALQAAGITPRLLRPDEQWLLPDFGVGLTNLVQRPSSRAAELAPDELRAGARTLTRKVTIWRPAVVAVLGLTAFRSAFSQPAAQAGRQRERIAGAVCFCLPNPSGLNARATVDTHARGLAAAARAAGLGNADT